MRKPLIYLGLGMAAAASLGWILGTFARLDLPDVRTLEEYQPAQMTRILARDGSEIAAFASEKRILLRYDEIPESFRHALIASEDSEFLRHTGIDVKGVARALWSDLRQRRLAQGASTLTMQLAGSLFLDRSQKTARRKAQEVLLALEIERRYSKQEILRLYANHVHMGHGLYGLEAAARFYFGKPARTLTTGESATLVGLLPRPASYSPLRNPTRAAERRDRVLRRMVVEGYLAAEEAERIRGEPLVVVQRPSESTSSAPYFVESVRRRIQESYGSRELYSGGLEVSTTLDPVLQAFAEQAVEIGLDRLGERQDRGEVGSEPVQAALIALDPGTGEVLAMVGGRDYSRSEFNRATQARRQTGSAFKPVVFAAALEQGWTLADTLLDEPTVFLDRRRPVPYQPENFNRRYFETVTLRTALEKSANIATVKLLDRIGYDAVLDLARDLGIESRLRPYPSLALGAFELTLLELTGAYATFANQGVRVEPHWIDTVTAGGRPLYRAEPAIREALSPQVAYLINHALSGVVQHGTAVAAAELGRTLAGKTGTTDAYTDAWFVGYTPSLAVGVWVGFDEPRSLGHGEGGSRAALPIWIEFMRQALAGTPNERFPVPAGVTFAPVDRRTGLRASRNAGCADRVREAFVDGSEPLQGCRHADHLRTELPYPFQRYPTDSDGLLAVPRNRLEELVHLEPEIELAPSGSALLQLTAYGVRAVPLRLEADAPEAVDAALMRERELDPSLWLGTDGRRARVVWFAESR